MINLIANESSVIDGNGTHKLEVLTNDVSVITVEGSVGSETVDDSVFEVQTEPTVRHDMQILANPLPLSAVSPPVVAEFHSTDEAIATVTETGSVETQANGTVSIDISAGGITKRIEFQAQETTEPEQRIFVEYATGSLAKEIVDTAATRLGVSTDTKIFTTRNDGSNNYTRNPSCFAGNVFSGVPVWNSHSGSNGMGVMLSPRHWLTARHVGRPANGTTVRFAGDTNTVSTRTVVDSVLVGHQYLDICISLLNADIASDVAFYKTLPTNWGEYVKNIQRIPILALNRQHRSLVRDWRSFLDDTYPSLSHVESVETGRLPVTGSVVGGDSGSPVFLQTSNETLALGTHYGTNGFRPIFALASEINAAMTTLGGGYQLTPIDLSSFTNYGV